MDFTLGSQYPGKYKYRRSLFRPHMVSACGKRTTNYLPYAAGVKSNRKEVGLLTLSPYLQRLPRENIQ